MEKPTFDVEHDVFLKYDVDDIEKLKRGIEIYSFNFDELSKKFKNIDKLSSIYDQTVYNKLSFFNDYSKEKFANYRDMWFKLKKKLATSPKKKTADKIRYEKDQNIIEDIDKCLFDITDAFCKLEEATPLLLTIDKYPDLINSKISQLKKCDQKIKTLNTAYKVIKKTPSKLLKFETYCKIKDLFDEYFSIFTEIETLKEERNEILSNFHEKIGGSVDEVLSCVTSNLKDINNILKTNIVESHTSYFDLSKFLLLSNAIIKRGQGSLKSITSIDKTYFEALDEFGLTRDDLSYNYKRTYDYDNYQNLDNYYDFSNNPEKVVDALNTTEIVSSRDNEKTYSNNIDIIHGGDDSKEVAESFDYSFDLGKSNELSTIVYSKHDDNQNKSGVINDSLPNQKDLKEENDYKYIVSFNNQIDLNCADLSEKERNVISYILSLNIKYFLENPMEINTLCSMSNKYYENIISKDVYEEYLKSFTNNYEILDREIDELAKNDADLTTINNSNLANTSELSDNSIDVNSTELHSDESIDGISYDEIHDLISNTQDTSSIFAPNDDSKINEFLESDLVKSSIEEATGVDYIEPVNNHKNRVNVNVQLKELIDKYKANELTSEEKENYYLKMYLQLDDESRRNIEKCPRRAIYLEDLENVGFDDVNGIQKLSKKALDIPDEYVFSQIVNEYIYRRDNSNSVSNKLNSVKDFASDKLRIISTKVCDDYSFLKLKVKTYLQMKKDMNAELKAEYNKRISEIKSSVDRGGRS